MQKNEGFLVNDDEDGVDELPIRHDSQKGDKCVRAQQSLVLRDYPHSVKLTETWRE